MYGTFCNSQSCIIATDIQGRSQTLYTTLCNGLVMHGAQIGGLSEFLPTTHTTTNAKQCIHDLCASCGILHMLYLQAQTAVDAGKYMHLTSND